MRGSKKIISFVFVSGTGWVIDFCIYTFLVSLLNFNVSVSNFVSSIPALTFVFLVSNGQIFSGKKSKISLKYKYFIYFLYQMILLVCISTFAEWTYSFLINSNRITYEILRQNIKLVVKVVITPITLMINFIVMKGLIEKI